jgi:hypothetical protein
MNQRDRWSDSRGHGRLTGSAACANLTLIILRVAHLAHRARKKGKIRGSLTVLRARRARTIRMCSLDARSIGRSGSNPLYEHRSNLGAVPGTRCSSRCNGSMTRAIGITPPIPLKRRSGHRWTAAMKPSQAAYTAMKRSLDGVFGQSQGVQIVIETLSCHQRDMRPLLHDSSLVQHQDLIRSLNGGQSVSDNESGSARHQEI